MINAFVNGKILTGGRVEAGLALLVMGDRIREVVPADAIPRDAERIDLDGGTLVPGFIDVQVNGGGGVLFNDSPTVEGVRAIAKAHAAYGTTGILPTTISASMETIGRAIAAIDGAIAGGVPGVLGIHIEGPFLSPARRGIHDLSHAREIDDSIITLLSSLKRGKTLLTLAPDVVKPETVAALTKAGVIVSLGHSDATYEQVNAALKAGARGFTHLFNAMSQLANRAPGVVGAALDAPDAWCGIIMDGHHVHPAALRVAWRCKGADKLVLVTDAMPTVGARDKTFTLQGRTITSRGGVCVGPDGTIAGADVGMDAVTRNAMTFLGADLATASRMASGSPAAFLSLQEETGEIARGRRADLVLLGDALEVRQTWIGGKPLQAVA